MSSGARKAGKNCCAIVRGGDSDRNRLCGGSKMVNRAIESDTENKSDLQIAIEVLSRGMMGGRNVELEEGGSFVRVPFGDGLSTAWIQREPAEMHLGKMKGATMACEVVPVSESIGRE